MPDANHTTTPTNHHPSAAPPPTVEAASAPVSAEPTPAPASALPSAGVPGMGGGGVFDFVDQKFTAYDDPQDPFYISPESRDAIIDKVAKAVEKWGLGVPATFLFSLAMPASFVAGQTLTVAGSPFLMPFFGRERVENWQNFLHGRKNVEMLVQRIENDLDAEAHQRFLARRQKKLDKKKAAAAPSAEDKSAAETADPA